MLERVYVTIRVRRFKLYLYTKILQTLRYNNNQKTDCEYTHIEVRNRMQRTCELEL